MSQGIQGADVDALRRLALDMTNAGEHLRTLGATIGTSIRTAPWYGPDQQQFVAGWDGGLFPALVRTADALSEQGDVLARNAEQQTLTSAGDGTSWQPGTPPGGGGLPPVSGIPGVPPGTPGSPSTPGDGNPDQWLGILPPWVGQVSNLAGLGVDFGGASLDVLDNFEILAASKVASGAAGGLGLVFGALGVVEGSYEIAGGVAEGDGWAVGDGAITAGLGAAGVVTGGLGVAAATGFIVSNPVGWAVGLGLAVGGGAWWGLQQLTPPGMETTEWLAGMGQDGVEWVADGVGTAWEAAGSAWDDAASATEDIIDGTAEFVDDVTAPLRNLFAFD
ncbi:hypothetical protein [Oerskovia jenensis]|uniref:hypothetical protein n=1 Tax=Oerskovia jenensis TaxID=162169 RepID=UPI0036DAA696